MDERSGRLTEPLCDAHREVHVGEASGAQIGQSAWRAVELVREIRPCKVALSASIVERCV
jgi:hypothetical protein